MKNLLIALAVITSLLGWSGSSEAAKVLGLDLKVSEGLTLKDSIGFAKNNGNGDNPDARGLVVGVYTGSLVGLHSATNYKAIGLGGFAFYASSSIEPDGGVNWIPTFTPVSFWEDAVHVDIGRNLQDRSYTVGLGVSGSLELLSKFGSAVTGMVTK